jgi:hypothetical protein
MAIPAVVIALAAAAGGALLMNKVQKDKARAFEAETARQQSLGLAASELIQGKTYAVQLVVTDKIGTKDVVTASNVIKSTMEQLGWKVLSTPVVRGPVDATAFATGQPSQWVFSGQWTKTDKFMQVFPPWAGSAIAFLLPVA